jgi:hypothetical protein
LYTGTRSHFGVHLSREATGFYGSTTEIRSGHSHEKADSYNVGYAFFTAVMLLSESAPYFRQIWRRCQCRSRVAMRLPVVVDVDLVTYAVMIVGECRCNRAKRDGCCRKGENGLFHDVPFCSAWTDVNRGGRLSLHGSDLISCSHGANVLRCVSRAPSRQPFEFMCISRPKFTVGSE